MKERIRIVFLAAAFLTASFLISYILIDQLQGIHLALLIFIVMIANWIIFGSAVTLLVKRYFSAYSEIRDIYSKYQMNKILYDLLKVLASVEESEDFYSLILEAATKAIPKAKFGSIIMNDLGKMTFKAAVGFNMDYLELIEMDIQDTVLYRQTNGKMDRPIIVSDILAEDLSQIDERIVDLLSSSGVKKVRSTMSVPIIISNSVVGSINLDSDQENAFNHSDVESLDFFALEVSKFVRLHQIIDLNRTMSRYDELTGIFNRGYCRRLIRDLMQKESPFVLISTDLNNLKTVNDLHGHDIGDLLIKSFVNQVKLFLPDDYIFARYGGDEFVIVLPGLSSVEATVIMEDMSRFFNQYTIREADFPLTISFCYGLVCFPDESSSYDEVLKLADNRMYRQKRVYKESNYGGLEYSSDL